GVRALQARRRGDRWARPAPTRGGGAPGGAPGAARGAPAAGALAAGAVGGGGRSPPQIPLQEMLGAFKEVVARAEMFAHHHIERERLSVGERMSDILAALEPGGFVPFAQLFRPHEGRMGVTITFVAILELMREGLIDIVQAEAYAPLHVRAGNA